MAFVEFHNVYKKYKMGDNIIVANNDLNFEIEKGEFVIIVGPSGAGKSTLLNILGGMDSVSEGRIVVDGREISAYGDRELTDYRRYDVGFVFQFYNLIPNLTAVENVELASELVEDAMDPVQILDAVGLAHRVNNFPAQLSGGEKLRVAIARALAKKPKLLLCDEPTGALDYKTGKQILHMLREECVATGTTSIVITHNKALTPIADRVIEVNDAKIRSVSINKAPCSIDEIEW